VRGARMITRLNNQNEALYAIFLALAGRYHPDLVGEPRDVAEARFRKIEEAYEVMRDALRSAESDAASPNQDENASSHRNRAALAGSHRKGRVELLIMAVLLVAAAFLLCYWIMDIRHRIVLSSLPQTDLSQPSNPASQVLSANQGSDPARRPEDSHLQSSTSLLSGPATQQNSQSNESDTVASSRQPLPGDGNPPGRPAPLSRDNQNDWKFHAWQLHDRQQGQRQECWRNRSIRGPCFHFQ
jgi:curved DNA-binding protein CbpA